MKILLVKLSSLGDILHNLPIVWDIRHQHPNAQIDWMIDELFIELIQPLKSTHEFRGIDNIIPIPLRKWHKDLKKMNFRHFPNEFKNMQKHLREHSYDLIIETQGLIKSAIVSRLAKLNPGAKIVGLGNKIEHSGYEGLSKLLYTHTVKMPKKSHAIDCYRDIAANALKLTPPNRKANPPQFYPMHVLKTLQEHDNPLKLEKNKYIICFHASARASKCWNFDAWLELSKLISNKGFTVVFPWGNAHEKKISEALASQLPNAYVPRSFSLSEALVLITHAKLCIGVDTGLTHLSAILIKPTIELYIDTPKWKTEGYWNEFIFNLGDKKTPPDLKQVKNIVEDLLAHSN